MKSVTSQAYFAVAQIILLLVAIAAFLIFNRSIVEQFFEVTKAGFQGWWLNGVIIALFLIGLLRIVWLLLSYAREQALLNSFVERARDKVANPTYKMPLEALIVERYQAVGILAQQQTEIDQAALAGVTATSESTRFTLVRFVNNTLILLGVLGTVISLSSSLMGAAGLLDSPDNVQNMGVIIGGMAAALSKTMTAIVCYLFFAYFNLRLQDVRNQFLANLEGATTLYIAPRFRTIESNMLHDVATLANELRAAAETIGTVQDRFLAAGERLQVAVSDLQAHTLKISNSSDDLRIIRDSIREGFRLDSRVVSTSVRSERSS